MAGADIERHGVESRAGNANANGHGVAKARSWGGGGCIYVVNIASLWHRKVNLFERPFKHYVKLYRQSMSYDRKQAVLNT